jgi:hypothetical protein
MKPTRNILKKVSPFLQIRKTVQFSPEAISFSPVEVNPALKHLAKIKPW